MLFNIRSIKPGWKIKYDIKHANNPNIPLVRAGQEITEGLLRTLENRGFKEIDIDITPEQLAEYEKEVGTVRSTFPQPEELTITPTEAKKIEKAISSLSKKTISAEDVNIVNQTSAYLVEKITKMNIYMYDLHTYTPREALRPDGKKPESEEELQYAKELATKQLQLEKTRMITEFAIAAAKEYNNQTEYSDRIVLEKIAIAALLQNIGECLKDDKVRSGYDVLEKLRSICPYLITENQEKLLAEYIERYIGYYSYLFVDKTALIDPATKQPILFSRESSSEKDYIKDKLLKSPKMYDEKYSKVTYLVASKILHIAIEFDKLLRENLENGVTLENVQAGLYKLIADDTIPIELIKCFTKAVPIYPVGTKVKLEGKQVTYGIVKKNYDNLSYYTRPVVYTIQGEEIDLAKDYTITITKVLDRQEDLFDLYDRELEDALILTKGLK